MPASPPAPISISGFRPMRSTVEMATKVKTRFTPPVITMLNRMSLRPYPAAAKISWA